VTSHPSFFLPPLTPHRDPPSFPTRRSSDLRPTGARFGRRSPRCVADSRTWPIIAPISVRGGAPSRRPRWSATQTPGSRASCALRSEEHTSELQSRVDLVCRLLLEKKKKKPF